MYAMSVTCDVSHDEMSVEARNVEQFSFRGEMGTVLHKKQVEHPLTAIKHICIIEHGLHVSHFRDYPTGQIRVKCSASAEHLVH
jgi:hypothetical protein